MSLEAVHLSKSFSGIAALDDVSISIPAGQVIALVGANGAGKSTLIKILTGYFADFSGSISIDGKADRLTLPAHAGSAGIRAVYQEVDTALIPALTVAENILMDQQADPSRKILVNWSSLNQQAETILHDVGLQLDIRKRVQDLALHEKQLLLIARAVSQNAHYLIFDEPTTSLSAPEVDRLFAIIRRLQQKGVGILYCSHRLNEVEEIADQVIVLRGGHKVGEFTKRPFNFSQITEAMLGTPLVEVFPQKPPPTVNPIVLSVREVSTPDKLRAISFDVKRGEILGITGLIGAGKTELLRALFGAAPTASGELLIDGKRIQLRSPSDAVQMGIYLVPEERRAQGVIIDSPVRINLSLPFLAQLSWVGGWVRRANELAYSYALIQRVGLVPAMPELPVAKLSGGNQQKVVIGKWLGGAPRVMLFDEPTQGIDVRSKHEIYQIIRDLSDTCAVIYASSDIDEVLGLADRVLVMRDGALVAGMNEGDMDRAAALGYATSTQSAIVNHKDELSRE